jgi:hypothetical protein
MDIVNSLSQIMDAFTNYESADEVTKDKYYSTVKSYFYDPETLRDEKNQYKLEDRIELCTKLSNWLYVEKDFDLVPITKLMLDFSYRYKISIPIHKKTYNFDGKILKLSFPYLLERNYFSDKPYKLNLHLKIIGQAPPKLFVQYFGEVIDCESSEIEEIALPKNDFILLELPDVNGPIVKINFTTEIEVNFSFTLIALTAV